MNLAEKIPVSKRWYRWTAVESSLAGTIRSRQQTDESGGGARRRAPKECGREPGHREDHRARGNHREDHMNVRVRIQFDLPGQEQQASMLSLARRLTNSRASVQ